MSLRSFARLLSAPNPLRTPANFPTVARFATAASSADQFYFNLRAQDGGEVEKSLATVTAELDPHCVTEVVRRCLPSQTQLGLRFFIWAGLQCGYRHTSYTYERACKSFKITRNPKIIRDVIEAYRTERFPVNVKTFKVVLNLCKEAKLAEEALWVLRTISEFGLRPDTVMYNLVIKLFCMKGDINTAESLMKEMGKNGLYPDMITCVEMVQGFCKAGRLDDAFGLLKAVKEHGCDPNTALYSALLNGFCQKGDMDRAMELLEEMERLEGEVSPNLVTYTIIIQQFCKKGQISDALKILDRMESRGFSPNRVTVSPLIEQFCKGKRVEEVHNLVDNFVRQGNASYDKCYSSFIVSLKRCGLFDEAHKVIWNMISCNLKPDGLACSLVLKELCSVGRVLEGFRLCVEIEKMGCLVTLDSEICSLLSARLCYCGCLLEAVELAKLMVKNRVRLVPPYIDVVVKILKKSGDDELVDDLIELGIRER